MPAARSSGVQLYPSCRVGCPKDTKPDDHTRCQTLVGTDGVPDRSSCAKHVVVAEDVGVVVDVVEVNLGADKEVSPDVVADTAADIHQEVTGAHKILAAKSAGTIRQIEASALPANAGHEIRADLLAQFGLVHGVEVRDDGTIGLSARSAVGSLARSPCSLEVEADALVEDYVGADTGVEASFFRTKASIWVARSGRRENVAAEHGVPLLGRGKLGEEQEGEKRCEKR